MSPSTTAAASTAVAPNTWERLWRASGVNAVALFIVGYFVFGSLPRIGAPADAVAAFYASHHTRILWAAVFFGLGGVLNLMWFAAAIRSTLREAGQGGWGSAATASSAAVGAVFLVLVSVCAALAYSIAGAGNGALTSGLNDLVWAGLVMSAFPRAMRSSLPLQELNSARGRTGRARSGRQRSSLCPVDDELAFGEVPARSRIVAVSGSEAISIFSMREQQEANAAPALTA